MVCVGGITKQCDILKNLKSTFNHLISAHIEYLMDYVLYMYSYRMLCRLTPPLCLNFLGLIHLDSHITYDERLQETSYTQVNIVI